MNANTNPADPRNPAPAKVPPEFFSLPSRGLDPHFAISRSGYYDLEARGFLQLVRLRKPGNVRGKVLVPYAKALTAIRALAERNDKAAS